MATRATVGRVDLPTGIVAEDFVRLASGPTVQACRATVRHGAWTTRVALLLAPPGEPPLTAAALAEVAASEPAGTVVATLEATGAGRATVAGPVAVEHRDAVAMAAAVCAASWGWDESARIRVFMQEREWVVGPAYREATWHATIVEEHDGAPSSLDREPSDAHGARHRALAVLRAVVPAPIRVAATLFGPLLGVLGVLWLAGVIGGEALGLPQSGRAWLTMVGALLAAGAGIEALERHARRSAGEEPPTVVSVRRRRVPPPPAGDSGDNAAT